MNSKNLTLTSSIEATVIIFMEQEKQPEAGMEAEPYQTRMLVTKNFLRLDYGDGSEDYVLFDRLKNIIYNINSEDKTAMIIEMTPGKVEPPFELKLSSTEMELPTGAPKVAGIKPQHYRLITNNEYCSDVIVVKGLLDDSVQAMREYNQVLASNNASTLHATPSDMQTPCMLSMNIFHVNQSMEYGFPVQAWDQKGKSRGLINYKEHQKLDISLFRLPEQFQYFSVKDFREGRVKRGE